MKHSFMRSLSFLRTSMILLNMVIVMFYVTVILLTTKYIVDSQLSREFLNQINHISHHPLVSFFGSIILYIMLVFIIVNRVSRTDIKHLNLLYCCLEIIICLALIYLLYVGYNGVLFLVFCDWIYHLKDSRYSKGVIGVVIFIYLITSYEIFSSFISITNIQEYFNVYGSQLSGVLMITKASLETLNIILFVAFMIVYIADEIQENENILKELDMIHQVNKELKNYATITEKIGEDNERKRLARELHDTLGHALTGIAAGVDASIAMIDINTQATKEQLKIVSKVVRQGLGDVRNSLNKLRPGALEEHGLRGAVERMIQEFSSVSDLKIELDWQVDNLDFEKTKEDIIFRTIQESITNALRHGGANHIHISIYQAEYMLYLRIKDNGIGCEDIHYGYGLKQMEERVMTINGKVIFDGHDGFLIMVEIPIQKGEFYDKDNHSR